MCRTGSGRLPVSCLIVLLGCRGPDDLLGNVHLLTSSEFGDSDTLGPSTAGQADTTSETDTSEQGFTGSTHDGSGSGGGSGSEGSGDAGAATETGIEQCPCAAGSELIYVLENGALWSFDPQLLNFERLAASPCGIVPVGMSLDLLSFALAGSGELYLLDATGRMSMSSISKPDTCMPLGSFLPVFPQFYSLAFAGDASPACELLFAHTLQSLYLEQGQQLGVLDPETSMFSVRNEATGFARLSLAGSADGRVFGFSGDVSPPQVVEFEPITGDLVAILSFPQEDEDEPPDGAQISIAFHGGDLWMFVALSSGDTDVWHIDYDESEGAGKTLEKVLEATPLMVRMAASSRCAPLSQG